MLFSSVVDFQHVLGSHNCKNDPCRYVTGILPPGNEDLKGDEADSIIAFKNALGLDDPDAAAVHIEVTA